jgi:hypothetical protein
VNISPEETEIIGSWETVAGRVTKDEQAHRVESLVRGYLKPVANSSGGWERLFKDPADGRFWELTYPNSELHGGGPPKLAVLTKEEATRRYEF